MSFKEDLAEVINRAKQEKDQEERERRDFENAWSDFKSSVVHSIFRDAAAVFARTGVGGETDLRNGSITLRALYGQGGHFQHHLTLKPEKEKLEILCSSSVDGDPSETFTMDALTQAVIEDKVRRFAYAVVRGKEGSGGGALARPFAL